MIEWGAGMHEIPQEIYRATNDAIDDAAYISDPAATVVPALYPLIAAHVARGIAEEIAAAFRDMPIRESERRNGIEIGYHIARRYEREARR